MHRLIFAVLAASLSITAHARVVAHDADISSYEKMIPAAWPHVSLRAEQRQWLATRSAMALGQCRRSGRSEALCRTLVREGLSETLGSQPIAAGLASRTW